MSKYEYYMAGLGHMEFELYGLAKDCYHELDKMGRLNSLRHIAHLGPLRDMAGAYYSRWEYVRLQLGVLHRLYRCLKDESKLTWAPGLSSNKTIPGLTDRNVTGMEVIQCWIMLLNAGHLPGTFTTARIFIEVLREEKRIRRSFWSGLGRGLPDNVKTRFNHMLQANDPHVFPGLMMLYFLERGYGHKNRCTVEHLRALLFEYMRLEQAAISNDRGRDGDGATGNRKVYDLFRKVRRLCYLFG